MGKKGPIRSQEMSHFGSYILYLKIMQSSHNIPDCMKEVTWLSYGRLPFILLTVFVQAAVIRSWCELIRPVCSLMRSINSFHNRLMLHHQIISQEVINTESWLTFQFPGICSAEFRYSFVFLPICWENTFSFFRQKPINMAAVTEQTTEAFDWKLIGFI